MRHLAADSAYVLSQRQNVQRQLVEEMKEAGAGAAEESNLRMARHSLQRVREPALRTAHMSHCQGFEEEEEAAAVVDARDPGALCGWS